MKAAWRLWLVPGLLGVTLLALIAVIAEGGHVQTDLARRVGAELANDGQGWASGDVSGRIVTIMGTAPTLLAQRLAVESAQRVWGVASVIDGSGIIPLQTPYTWAASWQNGRVVLTGFVPSDEVRLALATAAAKALPNVPVDDRTRLARGQPVTFLVLADFALQRLADLATGSVSLTGPELSIAGTAASDERFAAIATALAGQIPGGLAVRSLRVLPPLRADFAWKAEFDGKTVEINGFVPSDASRRDIASAIASVLPDVTIDDHATLASGAPDGFASAIIFAMTQTAHLQRGTVTLEGGRLSVEGKAKSIADYDMAVAEFAARKNRPEQGVVMGTVDVQPAHVDSYVWRAERDGKNLVLTGYVPSELAHRTVISAVLRLMPGVQTEDRIRVADGDPKMDWIGAVEYSLEQIALLDKGSVSLTGRRYDISGEAQSSTAYGTLTEALKKTLPASMELSKAAISPAAISPFVVSVTRLPDSLSLAGYVPTDDAAKAILDAARPKFTNDRLEARLILAGGAPDRLVEAVTAALLAVSRLEGGRADFVDRKVTLSGLAATDAARGSIEAEFRSELPNGFELSSTVTTAAGGDPLTGPDCQTALRAETDREQIQFDGNSSDILSNSFGLIDRIAAIAQRCPAATIEIGSHLDSSAGTKRSQAVSEARANAVADRLATDGVRRERLSPVGYGSSRPIASNSSAVGRAQNRRIEFNVVGL